MTAEVTVMNRQGVALAADSAVTIESQGNRKAWQSANKIFGLSHRHPLAIMIYGGAEIMGVPWDTVIKLYRDELGARSFPRVSDYADDFLTFLTKRKDLFPEDVQRVWFQATTTGTYVQIVKNISEQLREQFPDVTPVSIEDVRRVTAEAVDAALDRVENLTAPLSHVSTADLNSLRRRYAKVIQAAKAETFQDLPVTQSTSRKLTQLAILLFGRQMFSDTSSGVVIAGYGDEEHFPSLESLRVEAVINDRVNYFREPITVIDRDNSASVRAFAQGEMVYAFMEGVDQDYQGFIEQTIEALVREYPALILKQVKGISRARQEVMEQQLAGMADDVHRRLVDALSAVREEYYSQPIVHVVSVLPKDELAAMAEALVNLTSFRRRVSLQVETVGGPIDVAVISKGDGFVWIKRKNYFDLASNPHFVARYFRTLGLGGTP